MTKTTIETVSFPHSPRFSNIVCVVKRVDASVVQLAAKTFMACIQVQLWTRSTPANSSRSQRGADSTSPCKETAAPRSVSTTDAPRRPVCRCHHKRQVVSPCCRTERYRPVQTARSKTTLTLPAPQENSTSIIACLQLSSERTLPYVYLLQDTAPFWNFSEAIRGHHDARAQRSCRTDQTPC